MVDKIAHAIQMLLSNMLVAGARFGLEKMANMFNASVGALQTEVAMTPGQFSSTLLKSLEKLSENVVLPIAIMLITYVFVLQIIEEVTSKNRGSEWDTGSVIMLIIKTTMMIALTTNAFTIALAFSDLSTWMITKVDPTDVEISNDITDNILEAISPVIVEKNEGGEVVKERDESDIDDIPSEERDNCEWDYRLGDAFGTMLVGLVGMLTTMVICIIIYTVAWSRIIMVFLYITVAPIPMATLMSETWVNSIGQNYVKNLMALMLQGFLMLVLLMIYSGLIDHTTTLMQNGFQGLILLIASMAIIAKMLVGTSSLAKSITGAS